MNSTETITQTISSDDVASEVVIGAVAALKNQPAAELAPPLYEAIDPDALDYLVESLDGSSGRIEFTYAGYEITINSGIDTSVTVREA